MNSPTLTAASPSYGEPGTEMGMILGTAAYMAPEQARGKAVDRRADIWAFGVVLYEMLTGRRAFDGDDVSDTLAAVLRQDVDWTALPAATPPAVRRLLRRCLEKDPRRRLSAIGDARLELDDTESAVATGQPAPPVRRSMTRWFWPALAGTALVVAAAALLRPAPRPAPAAGHFTIALPDSAPLVTLDIPGPNEGPVAVAPDGQQLVYVAADGRSTRLYARAMADLTPRSLPGTEGARLPFFSPDGKWVGFFADGKLKKTPIAGGTPAILADAPTGCGASWSPSGEIAFAPSDTSGVFLVSDGGGTPAPSPRSTSRPATIRTDGRSGCLGAARFSSRSSPGAVKPRTSSWWTPRRVPGARCRKEPTSPATCPRCRALRPATSSS